MTMRAAILVSVFLAAGLTALAPSGALAQQKTVKECDAEYASNKAAIQGSGTLKKDFVAACRAGTETIPTAAPVPPVTAPAPKPMAAPVKPMAAPMAAPSATTAPTGANQYATDAQAKGRCPAGTVVWVNLKSKVYHFAGSKDYGTTKSGAYMCETDATAAGDRAAKNEKHP